MIGLLVVKFSLCCLAGLCNAGMDVTTHHWNTSIFRFWNEDFWNPAISWERKYKLPKWVPDSFSDGWHTFKWFMLAFLFAGVALPSGFLAWYWNSGFCWCAFFAGFWIGYNHLFLRK